MTLSEELTFRGMLNQTTYKNITSLDQAPITFYWGVDPSADSMTIGNLAAAMMVKCFIKHGHKAVLLIGGATGLIGDPDGKAEERSLKTKEAIDRNKQCLTHQYAQIFGGGSFVVVDNYDWFKDFNYLDFLRSVGKHVPVRQMLARDFVEKRLGEEGSGISYAEFSYVLIQAYDFLYLNEHNDVSLQVCGSDQWGNSIAGVDLIRRVNGNAVHVFSAPLIIDEATGKKFGKSEEGAIWLDPNKTSPTVFYQFWINMSDASCEKYLKIFTELSPEAINDIMIQHNRNPSDRLAQKALAHQATQLVHGAEAARAAELITDILIGKTNLSNVSDEGTISLLKKEVKSLRLTGSTDMAELLVNSGLSSSKTQSRQLLSSGAIYVNGQRFEAANLKSEDFESRYLLIRRGKAFKDSALVELG